MDRFIQQLRSGEAFSHSRVQRLAGAFLFFQLCVGVFFIAGTHGLIVPLAKPASTDFVSYYAAGKLSLSGHAAQAYDVAAHHAAEIAATEPGIEYNFFYYPPVYLLLCAVLAAFPYLLAFVLFQIAGLAPLLFAAARIIQTPAKAWLLPILAFPAVFWTVDTGQNAFLTAALLAWAMILIDRKPLLAGVLLGALCYKPHFGLLIILALIAGRQWRSCVSASLTVTGLVGLSLVLFGSETWAAFFRLLESAQTTYSARVFVPTFTNVYGAALTLGAPLSIAMSAQIVALAGLSAWTIYVWAKRIPRPLAAATLMAATPLAVPVSQFYDLILSGTALLWLLADARRNGFLPFEKTSIAVVFPLTALSGNLGPGQHIPFAALVALCIFSLTAGRVQRALRNTAEKKILPADLAANIQT